METILDDRFTGILWAGRFSASLTAILTRHFATRLQRITAVAADADALRRMGEHAALGIEAAHARARIRALVVDARPIASALVVRDALGTTAAVRIAEIASQTQARTGAILFFANGVRTARRRRARLRRAFGCDGHWGRRSLVKSWTGQQCSRWKTIEKVRDNRLAVHAQQNGGPTDTIWCANGNVRGQTCERLLRILRRQTANGSPSKPVSHTQTGE